MNIKSVRHKKVTENFIDYWYQECRTFIIYDEDYPSYEGYYHDGAKVALYTFRDVLGYSHQLWPMLWNETNF